MNKRMLLSAILLLAVASLSGWQMSERRSPLRIAASNYWGVLSPPQQSTSMADTLLGNAFEPLVDLASSGGIAPGLAESWEVNDESTLFTFKLRKDARFSDGSELSAHDFVRSWLEAVLVSELDSAQANTLDVLYKIKGFSLESARTGEVSGLRVIDGYTLQVEFTEPFRTALHELTGTRYAAWKRATRPDGHSEYIGTGAYQIAEHHAGKNIRYIPNPHAARSGRYSEILVEGFEDAWTEMKSGNWDIYLGQDPSGEIPSFIQQAPGSILGHTFLFVSGTKESLFLNPDFRTALQYLIHTRCLPQLRGDPYFSTDVDPQIYPALWPGRLDESIAVTFLEKGKTALNDLIQISQKRPIRFRYKNPNAEGILTCLKNQGLRFTDDSSQPLTSKEFIAVAYGKAPYDVAYVGANVVGSDPDSIYHLLGASGALNSPPIYRDDVSALLEQGRKMKRTEDLHGHYQKVTRAVLQEVPVIHLKFVRSSLFLNREKVKVAQSLHNSDRFLFDLIQK